MCKNTFISSHLHNMRCTYCKHVLHRINMHAKKQSTYAWFYFVYCNGNSHRPISPQWWISSRPESIHVSGDLRLPHARFNETDEGVADQQPRHMARRPATQFCRGLCCHQAMKLEVPYAKTLHHRQGMARVKFQTGFSFAKRLDNKPLAVPCLLEASNILWLGHPKSQPCSFCFRTGGKS